MSFPQISPQIAASALRHDGATLYRRIRAVCLVICLFPPMWATCGYFLCIYATKHMLRLGNYQTPMVLSQKFLTELFKLHARGWVLTLPALFAVWYWARELDASWIPSLASASIGFYLISTLPHHLLVNRLPVHGSLASES